MEMGWDGMGMGDGLRLAVGGNKKVGIRTCGRPCQKSEMHRHRHRCPSGEMRAKRRRRKGRQGEAEGSRHHPSWAFPWAQLNDDSTTPESQSQGPSPSRHARCWPRTCFVVPLMAAHNLNTGTLQCSNSATCSGTTARPTSLRVFLQVKSPPARPCLISHWSSGGSCPALTFLSPAQPIFSRFLTYSREGMPLPQLDQAHENNRPLSGYTAS